MGGRIRSIKPELPQSASLGRVTREARLLFVQLFTVCDDDGRGKASSRLLASTLYPYDDGEEGREVTKPSDIERWLLELMRERCIVLYDVGDNRYFKIIKWLEHQKIDKPSKPKFPGPDDPSATLFDDASRALAKPREETPRKGEDKDKDREGDGVLLPRATPALETSGAAAPASPAQPLRVVSRETDKPSGNSVTGNPTAAADPLAPVIQRLSDKVVELFAWDRERARVNGYIGDFALLREWLTTQKLTEQEILSAFADIAARKGTLEGSPWGYLTKVVPNVIERLRTAARQSGGASRLADDGDYVPLTRRNGHTDAEWRAKLRLWQRDSRRWNERNDGYPPDDERTRVPKDLLEEFGIVGPVAAA